MRTLYALMSHVAQVAQNGSTESSTTVLSLWDRHEEGKRYMRWWSRLRSTRSPGWDTRCRSTVAVCVLGIIAHCIPSPLQSGQIGSGAPPPHLLPFLVNDTRISSTRSNGLRDREAPRARHSKLSRYIPDPSLKRQIPGGAPPPIYG